MFSRPTRPASVSGIALSRISAGATSRLARTVRMTSRRAAGCPAARCKNRSYMVRAGGPASARSPKVAWPCGSMSTSSTRRCSRARKAERLMDVMVFPHPPFWFTTAIVRITHSSRRWCSFPNGPTVAKVPDDPTTICWGIHLWDPHRRGQLWVGFGLTSASFRSVSRGAGSEARVTRAASERRVDHSTLRHLALTAAALVRADSRLVQLEAAGHGPSAITLEGTDHVVVGRVGRQDVFPGVALSVRQQRPELAASPEDARPVVERDDLGRLARLREAPGNRSRGTPHEHGQRERNVDGITPHLGSPVPPGRDRGAAPVTQAAPSDPEHRNNGM